MNEPLGKGVHSAYEDEMVSAFRKQILDGLEHAPRKVKKTEHVTNGFEAAQRTIQLMRNTFNAIPPEKIVQTEPRRVCRRLVGLSYAAKAISCN